MKGTIFSNRAGIEYDYNTDALTAMNTLLSVLNSEKHDENAEVIRIKDAYSLEHNGDVYWTDLTII